MRWRQVRDAALWIPVAISFQDIVATLTVVKGRSMQPSLNTGWIVHRYRSPPYQYNMHAHGFTFQRQIGQAASGYTLANTALHVRAFIISSFRSSAGVDSDCAFQRPWLA